MPLVSGTRLGPYEVIAPLGAGGMGEVYRARDPRLGREVAVKVLPDEFSRDPDRLRRFEHEAKAVAALEHPHILAVHDTGRDGDRPYVVSELLEGQTLRERLAEGPLPPRKAIDVAAQIARGLAAAHDKGIVHRDLKPDNVFVRRDGQVKILDFGLAKLTGPALGAGSGVETETRGTDPGTVLGTVGYMSPEQVRGRALDHRTDIFALGALLYEMLTGRRAFRRDTAAETMTAILKEDPPDLAPMVPRLPPGLDRIVRHCLEKDPEERFASARDLAFGLAALSEPTAPQPTPAPGRARARLGIAAGLAAAALLAALAYELGGAAAPTAATRYQRLTFRRGTITGAAATQDGSQFFYSAAWDGEPQRVYSTRLDALEEVDLGIEGRLVGVGGGDLYVLRADDVLLRATLSGTGLREIAEGVWRATVSRDGRHTALVRRDHGMSRVEFPPGTKLFETPGEIFNLEISDRVDRFAVVERPNAGYTPARVGVLDLSGRIEWLMPVRGDVFGATWSPDGREIWFAAERGGDWSLRSIAPSGDERVLLATPQDVRIRQAIPDGRALMELAEGREEVHGLGAGQARERELSWLLSPQAYDISRDGRKVVIRAATPRQVGESTMSQGSTYLMGFDGKPPIRLGEGFGLALSPDERWVAALKQGIVLLPTGAGAARRLPGGGVEDHFDVRWLPDGKRLVFAGNEKGRPRRLFVQDLVGGPPRAVTPEGVSTEYPIPSPDGDWVAAGTNLWMEPFQLYPLSGGESRPIPGLAKGEEPLRFDADGTHLFVRTDPRDRSLARIARLDLRTGRREPWLEIQPDDRRGAESISVVYLTPDGRHYVYTFRRRLSTLFLVEGLR